MNGTLTTDFLDYLQRALAPGIPPDPAAGWTTAPPALRRLSRIDGVGRYEKPGAPAYSRPLAAGSQRRGGTGGAIDEGSPRHESEDVLIGLHGYKVPVAFLVRGRTGSGLTIDLGTWSSAEREAAAPGVLDARLGLVDSLLRSLHPRVDIAVPAGAGMLELPLAGLATGVPTSKPPDPADGAAPLDRLIRAMGDTDWEVLVLAEPVDEAVGIALRRAVINEMRSAKAAEQSEAAPSPLAQHYVELLGVLLSSLTVGHSVGLWRTSVYLLGDQTSYYRLAAAWRSVFSGERSLPEPLRVEDLAAWPVEQRDRAVGWGMPDEGAGPGPGAFRHPFQHQTLLHSVQLAAYVHFPRQETPGFAISLVPRFDTVSRQGAEGERVIELGRVMRADSPTGSAYRVPVRRLAQHTFVAGVTGSGKTNTVFHLLREADAAGVPFLVLEPAKAEYRALLNDAAVGPRMRVFTPGDESVSPFRINPFEVPEGTSVGQHLDLLRAVFGASFGMWTPLPQVLERCLHEIYADRGWDLATNTNRRLATGADAAERTASFPTLSDLISKVIDVVPSLGYEQRTTDDIRSALVTRLDALRAGGKGRMLDVRRSLPMEELLSAPAVLELEAMGDDDDKAFLMALLLVRLAEHRRAQGESRDLRHLVVVEEAHRVLSAVPRRTAEEQADPRGKAVETFSQLLSEVRAYGQGVVVADQVPVRLAPDVIKNTALKVAHRTVAADDREALGGAMAMDERQVVTVSILPQGEAAVFGDGDDAPILVRMPPAKGQPRPADAEVAARMSAWRSERGLEGLLDASEICAETCRGEPDACQTARRLTGNEALRMAVARIALSTTEEAGALDRQWPDLVAVARARRPAHVGEQALLRSIAGHASEWLAERRGAQGGWDYSATVAYGTALRRMLLERLDGATDGAREAFRTVALRLHARTFDPYPACSVVCDQADPPLCLYRHAMADLATSGRYAGDWSAAEDADFRREDLRRPAAWDVAQDAGYEAIEFPEDDLPAELRGAVAGGARRASLCFAQQMVLRDESRVPRAAGRIIARILDEAGIPAAAGPEDGVPDRPEEPALQEGGP